MHCVDLGESFPTSIYHLLAKFGFDTAENEPCKVCPLSAYRYPRYTDMFADMGPGLVSRDAAMQAQSQIARMDNEYKAKWVHPDGSPGRFWTDLQAHREYPELKQKRDKIEEKINELLK